MPTHLSGFKREYEWKNVESFCDSLFPASDSDHALISTDLVLFSFGFIFLWSREGQSGSHRENWHGMRQWWVRAGDETGSGTEQSMTEEWKSACQRVIKVYVHPSTLLCFWRFFCPCRSASVWVTHKEVGGSTTRSESLSRTRLFPPHVHEQTS